MTINKYILLFIVLFSCKKESYYTQIDNDFFYKTSIVNRFTYKNDTYIENKNKMEFQMQKENLGFNFFCNDIGLFIFEDTSNNVNAYHQILTFDTNNLNIEFKNSFLKNNWIFLPNTYKLIGKKEYEGKSVFKYVCDENISVHSTEIMYFLDDFGVIALIDIYSGYYYLIDSFSNTSNFSISTVKTILDELMIDSNYFYYPTPTPPPPVYE